MLAASKAQRACPQCRLQVLSLFENSFAPIRRESRQSASARLSVPRKSNSRLISTSRPRFQDVEPSETPVPPKADDIELTVRQAKHMFGNTLPKDYLSAQEYTVYERLYGPPLRETQPEDVAMPVSEGRILRHDPSDPSRRILLRETESGEVEEVAYYPENQAEEDDADEGSGVLLDPAEANLETLEAEELPSDAGLAYVSAIAKNQREFDALMKLQKDFEQSNMLPEENEEYDEEENPEEEEENGQEEEQEDEPGAVFGAIPRADRQTARDERLHPHSRIGLFRTSPSTVFLPKTDFVQPITKLLKRTDIKHIKQAAEKAFGGRSLPLSIATLPGRPNAPQTANPIHPGQPRMSEIDADAYMATNLPGMYASVTSILVEVRKRLGTKWLENLIERRNGGGPRVLDFGAGGAGLAAWEQILQAEWEVSLEEGKVSGPAPSGKKTVVVGSDPLRQRISRFLDNTSFIPRLPDYLHSVDHPDRIDGSESSFPRKEYDIIIAAHSMLPIKEDYRRKAMLDNLWEMLSPDGGILIVLEKGHPRGFEAVADVRSRLINEFIVSPSSDPVYGPTGEIMDESELPRQREEGTIIAPCTNHKPCPMYPTPGLTPGRKDFCRFSQRFTRPDFLQQVLGFKHSNHEDIDFSYVAIQRGTISDVERPTLPESGPDLTSRAFVGYEKLAESPNTLSLPRNILPPLKRKGHVTLELCTPAGTIERWTVPKSFSKQAYHDARKATWGDLWALGAKTRTERTVRLGRRDTASDDGGMRANKKPAKTDNSLDAIARRVTEAEKGMPPPNKSKKGVSPRRLRHGRKMLPDPMDGMPLWQQAEIMEKQKQQRDAEF